MLTILRRYLAPCQVRAVHFCQSTGEWFLLAKQGLYQCKIGLRESPRTSFTLNRSPAHAKNYREVIHTVD